MGLKSADWEKCIETVMVLLPELMKRDLSDLQEMTDDQEIKAVFCSRGGYGISRIISKVDFSSLKKNPKWYVGFSDITVLHLWLSEICGIISVHGEMPLNIQ